MAQLMMQLGQFIRDVRYSYLPLLARDADFCDPLTLSSWLPLLIKQERSAIYFKSVKAKNLRREIILNS